MCSLRNEIQTWRPSFFWTSSDRLNYLIVASVTTQICCHKKQIALWGSTRLHFILLHSFFHLFPIFLKSVFHTLKSSEQKCIALSIYKKKKHEKSWTCFCGASEYKMYFFLYQNCIRTRSKFIIEAKSGGKKHPKYKKNNGSIQIKTEN